MSIITYKNYRTLNANTPQSEPIPGETMILNNASGYSYKLDDWKKLERFIVLGSEGGTFYVGERKLTVDNALTVRRLIQEDGLRVVNTVLKFAQENRTPKVDPSLLVLALAISFGNDATKRRVIQVLPQVARIGTHIFTFVEFATAHRGWGRVLREAVANWYTSKPAEKLAYQVIKYQSRNGWSHRDLLRLSHAKADGSLNDVLRYAVKGSPALLGVETLEPLKQIYAAEQAKKIKPQGKGISEMVNLITDFDLPRECIPTEFLREKAIWEALLQKMPMTAMIRNLATMSRVGLLTPMSDAAVKVCERLGNAEVLRKARVHPIQLLSAYKVYSTGGSAGVFRSRGENFAPIGQISQALNDAFYASFGFVEPTGKRTLLALDTSSSMGLGTIVGVPGLTPREAAAVMAMVTVRSEWSDGAVKYPLYHMVNFTTTVKEFPVQPTDTLKSVVDLMAKQPHGGTDCAAPLQYALDKKLPVDTFVVYTDSETWAGRKGHPSELLDTYRRTMNKDAKLIVVGFTATDITIARPGDAGMLDVAGFDASTPNIISSFSRGLV